MLSIAVSKSSIIQSLIQNQVNDLEMITDLNRLLLNLKLPQTETLVPKEWYRGRYHCMSNFSDC